VNLPEGYAMRPAVLDDAADIAGVFNAESLAVVGQPVWSADETRANLQSPGIDLARDTRLVSAADGQTAGYVVVPITPRTCNFSRLWRFIRRMRAEGSAVRSQPGRRAAPGCRSVSPRRAPR
jgi:hypothetical protein